MKPGTRYEYVKVEGGKGKNRPEWQTQKVEKVSCSSKHGNTVYCLVSKLGGCNLGWRLACNDLRLSMRHCDMAYLLCSFSVGSPGEVRMMATAVASAVTLNFVLSFSIWSVQYRDLQITWWWRYPGYCEAWMIISRSTGARHSHNAIVVSLV